MDKNLDSIYQTLQKLIGLHRQMLETVRQERECLRAADIKGIQESIFAKEAIVAAIRAQEGERLRMTAGLAIEWKVPVRELSLQNLILKLQGIDGKAAEQFRTAQSALKLLIDRIREQNDDNRGLVELSLQHIQKMKKNVLGESAVRSETYTNQGQRSNNAGSSRFLSKEA